MINSFTIHCFFQVFGVAWFVCLFLGTWSLDLTSRELQQVSRLPKYISSIESVENSHCKLQFECQRCMENKVASKNYCQEAEEEEKCKFDKQIITKNQDVKICTPNMVKVCPDQPCETCPLYCQQLKQIWCEDDYKVRRYVHKLVSGGILRILLLLKSTGDAFRMHEGCMRDA